MRGLDIGPGNFPVVGFDSVDLHPGYNPTFRTSAQELRGVPREAYDVVHASHILEHIEWHQAAETVLRWTDALKEGGRLEIWVPDGRKLLNMALASDEEFKPAPSTWKDKLTKGDAYLYAMGRLLNYSKTGRTGNGDLNLHRSIWTEGYLLRFLREEIGLRDVRPMTLDEIRGPKRHASITLGACGIK